MVHGLKVALFCLATAGMALAKPGIVGYPYAVGAALIPAHDDGQYRPQLYAGHDDGQYRPGLYGGYYAGYDDGQYHAGLHDDGQYRPVISYAGPHDDGQYHPGLYDDGQYRGEGLYAGHYGYLGAVAAVPLDTPEVAAAKAAHFAAHARAAGHLYG